MSLNHPLVSLVGAGQPDRTQIALQVQREPVELTCAASVAELTPQTVEAIDLFLVWDDGKAIDQLQTHLSIFARHVPIVAIARAPSVKQVVAALTAGAVDYLEWPCEADTMLETLTGAIDAAARLQPLRERAIEARRQLSRLSRRERQILTAMAQGMSNKAIAELLEIEPKAIERDRLSLLGKLGVEHSAEAIRLELEASFSGERTRQVDWMAPWSLAEPRTRIG